MFRKPNEMPIKLKTSALLAHLFLALTVCLAAALGVALADDESKELVVETEALNLRLIPRTPAQMAAFYEGRGFPGAALEEIKKTCFMTVVIRNKSRTVIWLEPERWRFLTEKGELERIGRAYWQSKWRQRNIPQAKRSTFGWTLLPEVRDLQPDEPVGGNIVLPPTDQPFALEARFATGRDKHGEELTVRFDRLRCAKDR